MPSFLPLLAYLNACLPAFLCLSPMYVKDRHRRRRRQQQQQGNHAGMEWNEKCGHDRLQLGQQRLLLHSDDTTRTNTAPAGGGANTPTAPDGSTCSGSGSTGSGISSARTSVDPRAYPTSAAAGGRKITRSCPTLGRRHERRRTREEGEAAAAAGSAAPASRTRDGDQEDSASRGGGGRGGGEWFQPGAGNGGSEEGLTC